MQKQRGKTKHMHTVVSASKDANDNKHTNRNKQMWRQNRTLRRNAKPKQKHHKFRNNIEKDTHKLLMNTFENAYRNRCRR